MCHKKGHLSCNCPQHEWNQKKSQGCEAIVDDQSITDEEQTLIASGSTQMPQQCANAWLRSMESKGEDMQELVMRDLIGREDFQST